MDRSENRLRTFSCWPSDAPVAPGQASKAGFYSTGRGLEVQCWKCGGRISEWSPPVDLSLLHRRLDPSCPYASPPTPAPPHTDDTNDTIYKIDVLRLISFTDWPVSYISRESLASAGFYCKGGSVVRCAWCGGELSHWQRGDSPLQEHLRHFPHCHYARHKQREHNTTQQHRKQGASCVDNASLLSGRVEGVVLGVGGVAQPSMVGVAQREASYEGCWPQHITQRPRDLARAGFYYVGPDDQVRCFQCGGGLKQWRSGDDPWGEHIKWFPSCPFPPLSLSLRVDDLMGQQPATQALHCGLQAHAVRRAITTRLRETGTPFPDAESLINAALNEQEGEEEREEGERTFTPPSPLIYTTLTGLDGDREQRGEGGDQRGRDREQRGCEGEQRGDEGEQSSAVAPVQSNSSGESGREREEGVGGEVKGSSLEEENRKLKEARLCKVCMDSEVGIVFLPCGHLLTCVQCAPCLTACPLCRAPIKGVVRTYLS